MPQEQVITVLVAERDEKEVRRLQDMLRKGDSDGAIHVTSVNDYESVLERLGGKGIDAVLIDLALVAGDRDDPLTGLGRIGPDVPILVLIDAGDDAAGVRAVESGAQDYITRAELSAHALARAVRCAVERKRLERHNSVAAAKLQNAYFETIRQMALSIERRDGYTVGHQKRVSQLSVAIGREVNLPADDIDGLRIAGLIHDVGKVAVAVEILNKRAPLSTAEMRLIRNHTRVGYDLLKDIDFPWPVATMVLQHHERLDGSGYPDGIKGDGIITGARIMGVADVVEAMCADRSYRKAPGLDAALEEIDQRRDQYYDRDAVNACMALFRKKGFVFDAS